MPGPARVVHDGTAYGHHVGLTCHHNACGKLWLGNEAHGYDGQGGYRRLDRSRQPHLITGRKVDALLWRKPAARNMNVGRPGFFQGLGKHGAFLHVPAFVHKISARNAHAHRVIGRNSRKHGCKHLKRKAHSVFKAATVGIGAGIAERREELVHQVTVGCVQFNDIVPGAHCPLGRCHK